MRKAIIVTPILIILNLALMGCQCSGELPTGETMELVEEDGGEYLEEYTEDYDIVADTEDALEYNYFNEARAGHDVSIGDIIEFGDYDWRVLDVRGDYALIITENVHIIHNEGRYNHRLMNVTWESSTLRKYLNEEFLGGFDAVDRARIRETYVINEDNPWLDGKGGENTTDKIFILSIGEAVEYFGDSGQLQDRPEGMRWISDVYDSERVAVNLEGEPMWWWLRTPGQYQRLATGVDVKGFIFLYGTGVSNTGGGVRPTLWLNLASP